MGLDDKLYLERTVDNKRVWSPLLASGQKNIQVAIGQDGISGPSHATLNIRAPDSLRKMSYSLGRVQAAWWTLAVFLAADYLWVFTGTLSR